MAHLPEARGVYRSLATLLMTHEQVILYAEEESERTRLRRSSDFHLTSSRLPRPWPGMGDLEDRSHDERCGCGPKIGEPLLLPLTEFEHLRADGSLWEVNSASPLRSPQKFVKLLEHASPKAQQEANRRLREMLAYARGETVTTSFAQCATGGGMPIRRQTSALDVAIWDCLIEWHSAETEPRVSGRVMQLLEAHLQTHYAAPQAKSARRLSAVSTAVWTTRHPPVSERTFYRVAPRFHDSDVIAARRGRRPPTQLQPFYWLDQTTPRHGERPFALAHLDHTELDIRTHFVGDWQAVWQKPWATFLTDADSRRILACYVTYDPPSYRSVMMALRECVKRHQRLPQECFVDRGPEFGSVYFETLLTRHFVTKKDRPASQPRMGSVIERLFGTTTTQLLHQLLGNTKRAKHPR